MPQVTVYVREEDLPKWKALEKKSEWLHSALNSPEIVTEYRGVEIERSPAKLVPAPLKEQPFIPKPPNPETGYPCCQGTKACRHWHFNGEKQLWTNEITGKTREPES